MSDSAIMKLQNVSKEYPAPDGASPVPVLSDISLSVHEGDSISIVGPSGSGKSTLLNIMGALDIPTSGTVFFASVDLSELTDERRSYMRNQDIGFIFQMHHLLPQCSVIENVLIPTVPFRKRNTQDYYNKARELLEAVGMEKRIDYLPSELSGGEQLRTVVVRALINDPKLLLADEPTGSLDNRTADELARVITDMNRDRELTLVVVTHSEKLAGMMNRRYELKNGLLHPLA
jgi:ABC-type lipoprotein export system ATPase subunit